MELAGKERELKDLLLTVATQDIEPKEAGSVAIKRRVAKDRVISITDPEMRHGRKSSSRLFDGYKTPWTKKVSSSPPLPQPTAIPTIPRQLLHLIDQQPEEHWLKRK